MNIEIERLELSGRLNTAGRILEALEVLEFVRCGDMKSSYIRGPRLKGQECRQELNRVEMYERRLKLNNED